MKLYVTLRSSQERSLPLAEHSLSLQTKNFAIIEEYPFAAALKKMFTIGSAQDFPYLLALDADVILNPDALQRITMEADAYLKKFPNLLFLDFFVMDKFRGKCCSGCHLYINRYSKDLLHHLVDNQDPLRPENHLSLDFAKTKNLIHEKCTYVVGLHDFEQYYHHLYAKYFRRALRRKHEAEMLIGIIEARKKYFPSEDRDFEVVLKGLKDGMAYKGDSFELFDARQYQKIDRILPLIEKPAILPLK